MKRLPKTGSQIITLTFYYLPFTIYVLILFQAAKWTLFHKVIITNVLYYSNKLGAILSPSHSLVGRLNALRSFPNILQSSGSHAVCHSYDKSLCFCFLLCFFPGQPVDRSVIHKCDTWAGRRMCGGGSPLGVSLFALLLTAQLGLAWPGLALDTVWPMLSGSLDVDIARLAVAHLTHTETPVPLMSKTHIETHSCTHAETSVCVCVCGIWVVLFITQTLAQSPSV